MNIKTAENLYRDIKKLEEKYSLSYEEISKFYKNRKISIPVSIFNKELGSFESIVKYLKEDLNLSLKEVANLTNRNIKPVRTTYNRSKAKLHSKLKTDSKIYIPISIFQDKSILESIVSYLSGQNYSITQISNYLKRNYKTIWTIKNKIKNEK